MATVQLACASIDERGKISGGAVEQFQRHWGLEADGEYGAKVTHNGKRWISTIAANVYEPSVYGWDEVTT